MKNNLWQIFSTYTIPTTSDYLRVNFNSDDEFKDFIKWYFMLNLLKIFNYHVSKFNFLLKLLFL